MADKRNKAQQSGFPLRFDSKKQKEEFQKAAAYRRQSLTAFILTATEQLAREVLAQQQEAKAS